MADVNIDTSSPLLSILKDLAAQHAAAPGAIQGTHFEGAAPTTQVVTPVTGVDNTQQTDTGTGKVKQNTNLSLPDSQDLMKTINTQIDTISKIEDPLERQKALMEFQGNIESYKADTIKKHLDFANNSANVPLLQQQLEQSRKLDMQQKADYAIYGDSTITRKIQSQFDAAQARAESSAQKTLKTDSTLAAALAKADIFTRSQESFINNQINMQNRKSEQADMMLGSLNNDTLNWLGRISPALGGNVDKLKTSALALITGAQKKEALQVFDPQTTEADLPILAASGNGIAQKITAKLQADRTGQDEDTINKQLRVLSQGAQSDSNFQTIIKQYPTLLTEQQKKDYSQELIKATNEKDKERLVQVRAGILSKLPSFQNEQNLAGNVESWKVPPGIQNVTQDPDMLNAINQIKQAKNGKPVSVSDLISQYVQSAPKDQQADRLAKIRIMYGNAIDQNNKGIYGQVNKEALLLKAQAQSAIFQSMDNAINTIGQNFLDTFSTPGFTAY